MPSFIGVKNPRNKPSSNSPNSRPPPEAAVEPEAVKIKGAIRIDFVLSAEIIAITLGTVAGQDFTRQLLVLSAIAIIMTVGVYGLVAGAVKLDDAGLYLSQLRGSLQQRLVAAILWAAPLLMRFLSIAGTAAMFRVGGGIGTYLAPLTPSLLNGLCGLIAGTLVLLLFHAFQKIRGKSTVAESR